MDNELIFLIGETLLLEMTNVKNVCYPKGEQPTELYIELNNGRNFRLKLEAVDLY